MLFQVVLSAALVAANLAAALIVTGSSVRAEEAAAGDFIAVKDHVFPLYGGSSPDIFSVAPGNWSDGLVWSLGRPPQDGETVSVRHRLTYGAVSHAGYKSIIIEAGGALDFATGTDTRLGFEYLLVREGGRLQVGTANDPVRAKAELVVLNRPVDVSYDPQQYGGGIIGLGKITMHGLAKTTFAGLARTPATGSTSLQFKQPVFGWRTGDAVVIPDTVPDDVDEMEASPLRVAAVSDDGLTVSLNSPVGFDRPGVAEFLPHAGNLSRSVVVRSESAAGHRGHVYFFHRADVDICYTQFSGLGRTTNEPVDDAYWDASGALAHVGANQSERLPVLFNRVIGPAAAPSNGYSYTFIGNSIFCPLNPMPFRWGLTIQGSHYGLVTDNVIYNWAGAGLLTTLGNESYNVIRNNFIVRVNGTGERPGRGGAEIWRGGYGVALAGPNNYVSDLVAATMPSATYGYGVILYMMEGDSHSIPLFRGADPDLPWESAPFDPSTAPILELARLTIYGVRNGISNYYNGTSLGQTRFGTGGAIDDVTVWGFADWGWFGYDLSDLVVRRYTVRNTGGGTAFYGGDYYMRELKFIDVDIQGTYFGFEPSGRQEAMYIHGGTINSAIPVTVPSMASIYGGAYNAPRATVLDGVRFGPAFPGSPFTPIQMRYTTLGGENLIQEDQVLVYDFDGLPGQTFQVFFYEQDPDFVVPQFRETGNGYYFVAAPQEGLTNAQNWETAAWVVGFSPQGAVLDFKPVEVGLSLGYKRVAIAGRPAPCRDQAHGIHGYVCALEGSAPSAPTPAPPISTPPTVIPPLAGTPEIPPAATPIATISVPPTTATPETVEPVPSPIATKPAGRKPRPPANVRVKHSARTNTASIAFRYTYETGLSGFILEKRSKSAAKFSRVVRIAPSNGKDGAAVYRYDDTRWKRGQTYRVRAVYADGKASAWVVLRSFTSRTGRHYPSAGGFQARSQQHPSLGRAISNHSN